MANTYTRGVLTTGAGTYGYVQSISFSESGEEVLVKDEDGLTKVEDLYDDVYEVTVTAKFDRDATLPARGDAITLAASPKTAFNAKYIINSLTVDEVNTDTANVSIVMRRFADGGIPT